MVILGAEEEDKLFENCFRGGKKITKTTERATKGGSKVKLPAHDLCLNYYLIEPNI